MSGAAIGGSAGGGGTAVALVDRVEALLAGDARLAGLSIVRPHPLLVAASRPLDPHAPLARISVVFAAAALWDHARELLAPFADRLADFTTLVVLVGRPTDPRLGDAVHRGLASVISANANEDNLYVAALRAFDLMEARSRAESRDHWLRRHRYPVQSKLMSIADIYDALTASDRPYKKAVPVVRALGILDYGVRDGHLDGDLVRIFKDARVWERRRCALREFEARERGGGK